MVKFVRRQIFDGPLKPGQRVPQDEIAQILGVSRIPVREALIALEREGWITIYGFAVRRAVERQD